MTPATTTPDDMAALSPEICQYLRELALRMDAPGGAPTTPMVQAAAEFLGWSVPTVYRQLKAVAGRDSGRKVRSDKGSTSVPTEALTALGAAQREAVRDNGKQTLFTTTGRGMLENNGIEFGVTNSQLNRLMRDRRLNVAAQRVATPVQPLRAPHPNHTRQVDPSLCLLFYLGNKQHLMEDKEFYKNKLENYAKIKLKVYRYVDYDKASGAIVPWYVEAAGESQHNLFDFLMFAWGKQPGRLIHGVPRYLVWDKGSANTSAAIKGLLAQLEVTPLEHAAGHARVKGGVENANNIVETQFESRLRFEPVKDVVELNAAAAAWAEAYNANLIPGQDTRLRREGLAVPMARYDLWQMITAEQLRLLPSESVCRALMASRLETRQVVGKQSITFKHPAAERTATYSLRGLDGVNVGDTVEVRALVFGDCAIQVQVPRYDGEMLVYRLEPERDYDAFGQLQRAAVIGEEFKSPPKTEAQRAADAMDEAAYPGLDADELKKARDKKVTPFGNALNAHSYLKEVEVPTFLPRTGTQIEAPAHAAALVPRLDATAAMLRIVAKVGRHLTAAEHEFLSARYADGVPEDQIDALIDQFTAAPEPAPVRAAGGLRAV